MSVQSRPFGGGNVPNVPEDLEQAYGQYAWKESGNQVAPFQGSGFSVLTGGANGLVSDFSVVGSAGASTIFPSGLVGGTNRLHIDDAYFDVHGPTDAAGGTYVSLQDLSPGANVLTYFPTLALTAFKTLRFPLAGDSAWAKAVAVTAYAAGVVTSAASSWIGSNALAGLPVFVVAGTGIGQGGIIATNTTTALTLVNAFNTPLDTTSVVMVPYLIATAGGATTITASNAGWASGQFTDGGWYVTIIQGTGIGQVRPITSNTTTALTVPTWTTNPDTTSVFVVTRHPELMGAVAVPIQQQFTNAVYQGSGLQMTRAGTYSAGSNMRVRLLGHLVQAS
jgi:hypothetical protein